MLSDYEDERWVYTVVRTNTQGAPCTPFYSMLPQEGTVEVTGLINTMKSALDQLDREEAIADEQIANYITYIEEVRTITDPKDRPGLTSDEKVRLIENYRADRTHEAFARRREALKKSYESYAKQKGWRF